MPPTPFGDHLRREREMRGVTISEIAAATRISERFLEALENGQWDRLPGGAFNRGFIRSVARFLGLDEESLVAEYTLETKGLTAPASSTATAPEGLPRDWRPLIAAGVALIVLVLAGVLAVHYLRARARARAEQGTNATAFPVAPADAPLRPAGPPSGAN